MAAFGTAAALHGAGANVGGDVSRCPFLNGSYGRVREQARRPLRSALQMAYREDGLAEVQRPEPAQAGAKCPFHAQGAKDSAQTPNFGVEPERLASSAEENLRGFIKTRGSLRPGDEFVFWWVGDIYAMVDEQPSRHLFSFEGYNIGRMARVDGGWRLLTREVGLYKDPLTGEILHESKPWLNPLTGEQNQLVHCWNDPVNQQFLLRSERGEFKVPTTISGDDVLWNAEIFLSYPSPLPRAEFPQSAQSDCYQSAELFQFYTKQDDLRDPRSVSAPCLISWVRVGQWLPWMNMGDRDGKLVYHCRGKKLERGFEDLSPQVRAYIDEVGKHEFAEAPLDFSRPNETSWTYFKKLLKQKGAPRADGTTAIDSASGYETEASEAQREFVAASPPSSRPRSMTRAELAEFDGTDVNKPLLLSIAGRIYDVSRGRKHYRKGETYNCLVGVDATAAFVNGSMLPVGVARGKLTAGVRMNRAEIEALPVDKQQDLKHWVAFFDKEYDYVGELADL
uniref:Cytochrome b5 heme-binding domain-containing protein n=1 Tax=Erythrolobus australicus TaxID=1077150 RepID=A0A7S1TLK6_9RHOD